MKNVVSGVETFNADQLGGTDTIYAEDFGDAMLETKQPGPPFVYDSFVGSGYI